VATKNIVRSDFIGFFATTFSTRLMAQASVATLTTAGRLAPMGIGAWKSARRRGRMVKTDQHQPKALQKALNNDDQPQLPNLA
jgi:hypothetical protein